MKKNNFKNLEILAKEWLLKAQDDERSAEILLKENGAPNTICFLSQQMVEKYLKAYLIFNGERFPKMHDLDKLCKLAQKIEPEFRKIESESKYLTEFYISARYPGDYPYYSFKDAKNAFGKASKIKKFILEKMKL